jgi:hypothetical protein
MSLRSWFSRKGIASSVGRKDNEEIISIRNSLKNHVGGLQRGLLDNIRTFSGSANGDGYSRGCKHEGSGPFGELTHAIPQWVPVSNNETRTIEGVLTQSKISTEDFPLKPWHTYYDWLFYIEPDKQYTYLLNTKRGPIIECEWDTAFLPNWAWPQQGSRIWMVGRWIYDCGHPEDSGHNSEIHPPKAVVTFRTEAVKFPGNKGPTRANNAIVYIGRKGGYWTHNINDQDYAFDIYLPPKPYVEAEPVAKVESKTGPLPVNPQITPYPEANPKAMRVVIPLKGVEPHPNEYGAIISVGWSDPKDTERKKILPLKVSARLTSKMKITTDAHGRKHDNRPYVNLALGINGRWFDRIHYQMNAGWYFEIILDLHPEDTVRFSICGFKVKTSDAPGGSGPHHHMGDESGLQWQIIANADKTMTDSIIASIVIKLADTFGVKVNYPFYTLFFVKRLTDLDGDKIDIPGMGGWDFEYSIKRRAS